MSITPTFHIRDLVEGPEDGQFMLDAFDASLAQLASIGSSGQWGTQPFSERPDRTGRLAGAVEQAMRYQSTGEGDAVRIFVAEAGIPSSSATPTITTTTDETLSLPPSSSARIRTDDDGKRRFLAVGCVMLLDGHYPRTMPLFFHRDLIKQALDGTGDYVYLEALITDFRAGPWRKGAGAALIEHARRFCRERGKRFLYVDSYAGNNRKLVRYYESQGFTVVDELEVKSPDGSPWPAAFYRMDVTG